MNLTIKDVPAKLHRKLRSRANENNRSLNWEVIDILEQAVDPKPVDVEQLLAEVERIHARVNLPPLTEGFLREAKNAGRP
jgi:plasmid stability protein